MNPLVSLYGIIADLRREHQTPAAMQTLDMVTAELGGTRDNLKEAVANLEDKPLPSGSKPVLDELVQRARQEGVYDLDYGPDPYDKPPLEPLDEGTAGIGALRAISSLAGVALAILAAALGLKTGDLQIDWPVVLKRKQAVVDQLWRGVEFLLKKNKVTVFKGEGTIESEHKVVVKGSGEAINARNLVVATGSRPKSLAGLSMDGDRVINSDHAVNLEQMPKSIVIVGAGAVGTEFACVYNGYGADVTLVEFLPTLLPLEDAEVGQQLAKVLTKRGIKVLTGAQLQPDTLKRANGKMTVAVKSGEQTQTIEGERLLVAVGREGITDGFGLEKLDIQLEKGYIKTDEHYRTGHPNVYAAGDVIGNFLLAHVAYYEGEHIMEQIAGKNPKPLDYNRVPRATYSYPQVASLGLSEKQARDQGLKVKVGKFPLAGNAK